MTTEDDRRSMGSQQTSQQKLEAMLKDFEANDTANGAQLRVLIERDQAFKASLLQAIESGKIQSFIPEVSTHGIFNRYDLENRSLAISSIALKESKSGSESDLRCATELLKKEVAKANLSPEQRLDAALDEFESKQPKIKGKPDERLREMIASSPLLQQQMMKALDDGHLTALDGQSGKLKNNAGASYNHSDTTITFKLDHLEGRDDNAKKQAKANLIFDLAHETTHAIDKKKIDAASTELQQDAEKVAKSGDRRDYTQAIEKYLDKHRVTEASAHLAGFNAIASMVRTENPNATLKDVYDALPEGRRKDFFKERGKLLEGLSPDGNLLLQPNDQNIGAMSKYYFGKSGDVAKLGNNGNLDYRNLYATDAIETIYSVERSHPNPKAVVLIDMKRLELDEKKMEGNLQFPNNAKQAYVDTSEGKEKPRFFDPEEKVPKSDGKVVSAPQGPREPKPVRLPCSENETGNAFVQELVPKMETLRERLKIDPKDSRSFDNLIASAASSAISGKLKNIDQVVLNDDNTKLFVTDGVREFANRVAVDVQRGMNRPAEFSVAAIEHEQKPSVQELSSPSPTQERAPRAV